MPSGRTNAVDPATGIPAEVAANGQGVKASRQGTRIGREFHCYRELGERGLQSTPRGIQRPNAFVRAKVRRASQASGFPVTLRTEYL